MRFMLIEKILGTANDLGTTQTEFLLSIRLSGIDKSLSVVYIDSGNNAEYESRCMPYANSCDDVDDSDIDMIYEVLDSNNDKIDEGNMFAINCDNYEHIHITFTNVLEVEKWKQKH